MATLEEAPVYVFSAQHVDLRDRRYVPDVPEDVSFMEHFNDPNYDLTQSPPPAFSPVERKNDIDAESRFDSDRYSTSCPESGRSTTIDFDE